MQPSFMACFANRRRGRSQLYVMYLLLLGCDQYGRLYAMTTRVVLYSRGPVEFVPQDTAVADCE